MHVTVVNTQTVSSCTALSMRVLRVSALYTLKLYTIMLEVGNIDMMLFINLFPVGWLPMITSCPLNFIQYGFSIAAL